VSFGKGLAGLALVCLLPVLSAAQAKEIPEWCKPLPRPEYKALERVLPSEPWFEVYKVSPGVFAIYEPHQAEETISYLVVGSKQAPAVRYRHGGREHSRRDRAIDVAPRRRAELAHAQRSRWRQLAVSICLWNGHGFHSRQR